MYRRTSQWSALIITCIPTYEVDMGEMARRAIHNMIKKITSDNFKGGVTVVEGRLVLKDSVSHV